MKKVLILGGGGFIGSNMAKRLKSEGHWVRVADIKQKPDYFESSEICDEYFCTDLRESQNVQEVFKGHIFDEVQQYAADMGGAMHVFSGLHDADIIHNSLLINLHVAQAAVTYGVGRLFFSSSACRYAEHNQLDPNNPNCEESSAYPASPDSLYGWEKLTSEQVYQAYNRNYNLDIRLGIFHNIFGYFGTYQGGREKAPAAVCRKVIECILSGDNEIEIWGPGTQTRSFLFIDDCLESVSRFMNQDSFAGPVNIGSTEMISINDLAKMAIDISGKNIKIRNIDGQDFFDKYGFKCPIGVNGRNSDNQLYREKMGWEPSTSLRVGMEKTYAWIYNEMTKK
jgi:nucleoside-diphosphate-sugar epimerase